MRQPRRSLRDSNGYCIDTRGEKGNGQAHVVGVNPYAEQFYLFLQFGQSARSLKTAVGHGQGGTLSTSSSHAAEIDSPVERGQIGYRTRASERTHRRFFTAMRVQPHGAPPEGTDLPVGEQQWSWIELAPEIADLCGLHTFWERRDGGG